MIVGKINPYSYSQIPTKNLEESEHPKLKIQRFSFRDRKGYRYCVEAEQYEFNTYAIKFYVLKHASSPLRYNHLTNHKDARRIIETCLQIGVDLYKQNDLISFCFIGAPTKEEFDEVGYNQTKRFRVYALISKFLLNPETFEHTEVAESSFYILVNKKAAQNTPKLFDKIRRMFADNYDMNTFFPSLDELQTRKLTRGCVTPPRKQR